MHSEDFYHAAAADLGALGHQRVWSLLVTVFGDLAQNSGDTIDGPILSELMTAMEIKPEATRVALHRLRADNWIASKKVGRTSRHGLTARGLRETRAATPRIYGRPEDMARDWKLIIVERVTEAQSQRLQSAGFASLMSRVFVGAAAAKPPDRALVLHPDNVPDWIGEQFEPKDQAQDYAALHAVLSGLKARIPDRPDLTEKQIAVLRCLIVHAWRRLVLRHPDLPPQVYSPDWKGHACRALVTDLLARLPRPDLATLHSGR